LYNIPCNCKRDFHLNQRISFLVKDFISQIISQINDLRKENYFISVNRANEICTADCINKQATYITAASAPEDLGDNGLRSMHDGLLAVATLAMDGGSATTRISMHLLATR
jgi:hypothetical protein